MELNEAKNRTEILLNEYSAKISKFGIKNEAYAYFSDSKTLDECEIDDPILDSVCGCITMGTLDAKDENDMCGFDIILRVNKKKEIDEESFSLEIEKFKQTLDCFIERLESSEDKNAFIKDEAEREKQMYAEQLQKFKKRIKTIQIGSIALFVILVLFAMILTFILLS